MASRLKWVKAMAREVIQGGTRFGNPSDCGGLKGSFQVIRLLKGKHWECSSWFSSMREKRRRSASDESAHTYLQNGSTLKEAVTSLINSVYQGIAINSYTYVDFLQECFKQKDLESVKQVHGCIKKSGLEENSFVVNNLLKCYIGCARMQIAQELFNKFLNKTIVSWNIMIGGYAENDQAEDAVQIYERLRSEGGQPDAVTYMNVLKACASPAALTWGNHIYAHILEDGFQADVRVGTALVSMYAKCGSVEDARAVFDTMERRNLISWNAMICGLAQHGHGYEAFSLFNLMQREGFTPDFITYLCILSGSANPEDLAWVKEAHSHAKKSRLAQKLCVNNALIGMYAKCGSMDDAKLVFNSMMNRDVISWNVMIGGLAQHGLGHEAFSLFLQMQREGFVPDAITYVSILNPRSSAGALEWVKEVHGHATKAGLDVGLRVGNALVHMYAKTGSIGDARRVFDKMMNRDVVSWTVMIGGLAQHGLGHEAFSLFLHMQREGLTPDAVTYVSILNVCSSTGAFEWVKKVHAHAMKAGLDIDLRVGNALVHMYARIGSIGEARQVFEKMLDRDIASWTAMMGGLAQHGHGREALQLFEIMKVKGVKPSGTLFVTVLSACSHVGLVDEGRFQFLCMKRDYDLEPALEHYTCMIDILGRAGHLEEAKLTILNMPIDPDVVTWTSLLGSCKLHKNTELAKLAAKECLKLKPTDSSSYVLLSNVYAAVGDWDQRSLVRKMMEESGIRKDPGR